MVKRLTQHTFAEQIDQASAKSGEMLTKQILLSGLREADFSRLPVGPRRCAGPTKSAGASRGRGSCRDVINLLFLLQESPYVHRMENLAVSAGEAPGQVRVGFRFLTLVVDAAPAVDPIPLPVKLTLESPERRLFDRIAARDLLRPYVKRAPGSSGGPISERPPASGPASLRVVSLSEWSGEPEVHVRDLNNQKTIRYRLGDELADGSSRWWITAHCRCRATKA